MQIAKIACTVLLLVTASASAQQTFSMRIGAIDETYSVHVIQPQAKQEFPMQIVPLTGTLLLRWIIADDIEGHAYDFEIRHDGNTVTRRAGATDGFGRRSAFVPYSFASAPPQPVGLEIINHSREPLHIESLEAIPDFDRWLAQPLPDNDFTLALLVNEQTTEAKAFGAANKLETAPGVRRALAREIYYAKLTAAELESELRAVREYCRKFEMQFLAITCSWWAGTPKEVWTRPEFQQVCWSETDTHDSGPELKKLLGDKWDIRYGWTVPNMWSNTPWQTMNHPELNALRHERMAQAVKIIEREMKGPLIGYVAENEPAYWAWEAADYAYPVKRKNLWADFNPVTVAAARSAGVDLNPHNGLSFKERMWLHGNLTDYMQDNIDVLTTAGASGTIYSHALLAQMFPLQGTGRFHPYAETARIRNAHVGLETLWKVDFDGLWRVREWGPWACVNREENDGVGLDYHLAMLQVEYMMGAELFNSYNWNSINENGRCMAYFNGFMSNLREGGFVKAGERTGGSEWKSAANLHAPLEVRPEFPWSNQIRLKVRPKTGASNLLIRLTRGINSDIIACNTISPNHAAETGETIIDFGDITAIAQEEPISLHLEGEGWEILHGEDGPDYILGCDLKKERRRSQYIIHKMESADSQ